MAELYSYNFDEASGAILDRSGNGRDVALSGNLARATPGGAWTGSVLKPSSVAVESPGPAIAGLQTAQFTVMFWVERSNNLVDGWACELKASGSGDRGILFLSGAVQVRARNSGGTVANKSTTQPTANTRYHVAGTYDGSSLHLFINGSEITPAVALAGPLKTTSTGSHLVDGLGAETQIDDVRYFDTALDAVTITTLMSTPVSAGDSFTETPTDSAGSTDNSTVRLDRAAAWTDSAGSQDSVALSAAIGAVAVDSAGVSDGVELVLQASSEVADSAGSTDTVVVQLSSGTERDLALRAGIETSRFRATIEPGRFVTSIEPGLDGDLQWP